MTSSYNSKQDRTDLPWHKGQRLIAVLAISLGCAFLPAVAFAQNNSTDPDAGAETPDYIGLNLDQSIVIAGDPFTGTASIYEGDGDVDTDDSISVSSSNGDGTVNFSVPTSSPGEVTIIASSPDAPNQSKVGYAVALNAVLHPNDDFAGRSQTSYGVGEQVKLSVTTTPAGYESQVGTLNWTGSGDGVTSDFGGGNGRFTAGEVGGSATITLTVTPVTKGTPHGKAYPISRTIVAPSGVTYVQSGGVIHTHGFATAGFFAWMYITPKDVSFHYIQEQEEDGVLGDGSGSLQSKDDDPHTGGGYNSVGTGNIVLGSRVAKRDHVNANNGAGPFAEDGDFYWYIPRDYMVGDNGNEHDGYTIVTHHNHQSATDATGNSVTTMTKAGVSVSAKQNDPTSK